MDRVDEIILKRFAVFVFNTAGVVFRMARAKPRTHLISLYGWGKGTFRMARAKPRTQQFKPSTPLRHFHHGLSPVPH